MTDKLTDEQLRQMACGQPASNQAWVRAATELLALRAERAKLEALLMEVRQRVYDCKHNAMFSSKDTIVTYMYELLPHIDAALAQPAESGATTTGQPAKSNSCSRWPRCECHSPADCPTHTGAKP